ncbi:hypothetical protein N8385_04915 [Cyclobacteriaceae bacterium]|jgi:hypothetical protein|nr:hypothetical protein [Cyclobacteriaceae bacterium]|tara:strand:- start:249 stop:704 length:456 start_codon:yes stop_codon:yes gene_type:complete
MKIGTENLHLILTEELYKVDEIDKTGSTNQIIPPEPGQSEELPLETKEVSLSPGLQVITEPLTDTSRATLTKLLKAIHQDIETTSVIESWEGAILFEKTLIFGHQDEKTELNTLQEKESHQILHTHNIPYLDRHKDAKIELWQVLKTWFSA